MGFERGVPARMHGLVEQKKVCQDDRRDMWVGETYQGRKVIPFIDPKTISPS